jgi:putative zinc finger/helix-turn-helix YgiT family protein
MERTIYCPSCECDRVFRSDERVHEYDVRGEKVSVTVPQWVCAECAESIVDESFGDPVARAFDAYREKHGLLAAPEIQRIREQWGLSQVAFATLLGMSPATINRYEQGSLQQEKEDELIRACDKAEFMQDLLRRRGSLLSQRQRQTAEAKLGKQAGARVAYWETGFYESMPVEVSKRSGFRAFDFDRYAAVVAWLCKNVQLVTQTKLYKLLFYADFLGFRATSRSITGALYRRMPYGPVPVGFSGLRAQLEDDDVVTISEMAFQNDNTGEVFQPGANAEATLGVLSDEDIRVLKFVRDRLGSLTPTQISDKSHEESAWRDTPSKGIISYEKAGELSLALPIA